MVCFKKHTKTISRYNLLFGILTFSVLKVSNMFCNKRIYLSNGKYFYPTVNKLEIYIVIKSKEPHLHEGEGLIPKTNLKHS